MLIKIRELTSTLHQVDRASPVVGMSRSKRANTEEQNKQLRVEYRSLKKATKEKEPEILTLREPTFREFIDKGNLLGQRVDTVGIAVEDVQQVRVRFMSLICFLGQKNG